MKRILVLLAVLLGFTATGNLSRAQTPAASLPEAQLWSDADLDILLGPIALYPDPLIAVLLPAATHPGEIVMASRYLINGGETEYIDAQPWSDSVKALSHYPDVVKWMDENLPWTTQVGEAFLAQPEQVMDAIQRLRARAQALGNLQSTPQQIVDAADGDIDVLPVDPDYLYVPVYDARVYSSPAARGPFVSFRSGVRVSKWLNHDWDWKNRRVVVWSKDQPRPRGWWCQPRAQRFGASKNCGEWTPRARRGHAPSKWWAARGKNSPSGSSAGARPSQGISHTTGTARAIR